MTERLGADLIWMTGCIFPSCSCDWQGVGVRVMSGAPERIIGHFSAE